MRVEFGGRWNVVQVEFGRGNLVKEIWWKAFQAILVKGRKRFY